MRLTSIAAPASPAVSGRGPKTVTIIQLPSGESYGTTFETVAEARARLESGGWLVQVLGNVVRMVRNVSWTRGQS